MAYPASLDELTDGVPADNIAATTAMDNATYPHDDHHRALATAVEAVEAELGTDPAGASATVKARLDALDTTVDAKVAKSLVDAAGDLLVGSAADTVARLAMGTASQVLRVNSGATGLEWAAAAGGGGVSTQAARPIVDAGTNQRFWFCRSRGDINGGTFKIRFNGGSLSNATTAAIDVSADWASSGAGGLIGKLEAVLGTKDTDWQWFAGSGSGGQPYELQFGLELIGAHANTPVVASIVDSTLTHSGTPGDTFMIVQWFGARPANAAVDTGDAGDLVIDTAEDRLWVATEADTWQQVSTFPYADTPPIRLSSSDPPNDTNLENAWSWGVVPPAYQRRNGLLFVTGTVAACASDGSSPATGNNIATLPVGFRPESDWHIECRVSGCTTITSVLMGFDAPDPSNFTAGSTGGGIFPVLPAYAPGNPTYLEIIADRDLTGGGKTPTIWLALQGVPIDLEFVEES